MPMVFKATKKLMLWYLEQSVNSCYRIQSNQEINAKGKGNLPLLISDMGKKTVLNLAH